jgi:hypothetical protein
MPHAKQKAAAQLRAAFTDEHEDTAFAGVARNGGLGLDECTDGQAQLRALLALGLLNNGAIQAAPGAWWMASLSVYSITVSPRWNRLVLITNVPDNVARYFVPTTQCGMGLPGLEISTYSEYAWSSVYVLHHRPTGADIEITARTIPRREDSHRRSPLPAARAVAVESRQADVPRMSPDARTLLAGLTARFAALDPRRQWAVGNFHFDPWERGLVKEPILGISRRLWGSGDEWELVWDGYPAPADLAAALTDEVAGVPGAVAVQHRRSIMIHLGSAVLELRSWES